MFDGITDRNGRAYLSFGPDCFATSGNGSSDRVGVVLSDGTLFMGFPFISTQLECRDRDVTLDVGTRSLQSAARYNAGSMICESLGQPVNVTTGNMWLKQNDYAGPGAGYLNVSRTYNSTVQESGKFGFGWNSELDIRLSAPYVNSTPTQNISFVQLQVEGGRVADFVRSGTTGVYRAATPDFYAVLEQIGTEYLITWKDGRTWNFSSEGLLLWKKDRNGNQTTRRRHTDTTTSRV